mgnify:CR=1 FL=1|tara:strand:- start:1376 stop:5374 length:3999 start_codon:yes stop_codon:yes gene_type:complete
MATVSQDGPWSNNWMGTVDPQKGAMPSPKDGPWMNDWNQDEVKTYPENNGPWTVDWTNQAPENLRNDSITFGKSWDAGMEMAKQTIGGSVELAGELIGDNDWGKFVSETGAEWRREAIKAEQKYPSPLSFTNDVLEPLKRGEWDEARIGDWAVDTLGRVAPMMLGGGVGAAGGAIVGATRGGVGGAGIGAAAGAGLAMFPINTGEVFNEIKAQDESLDGRQRAYAIGTGTFNTFLDVASFGVSFKPILKGLFTHMSKDAAKDSAKRIIMRRFNKSKEFAEAAIIAATVEGATEATQEAAIIAAVNQATGKNFDTDSVIDRLQDAGAAGLFVGGVTGGSSSLASQFIAPNAKAQVAINESAFVDDPRRQGRVPGAIRETPVDYETDSVNSVIESFNLPMFTPGKLFGEAPIFGRAGQQGLKNIFNTIGGKSAHRYLHYAGTSEAWAQVISRIVPQENNSSALEMGYHEAVLARQGAMQQDLGNIFRKLHDARDGKLMSDLENETLLNAIEDTRGKGIIYKVWDTGKRVAGKFREFNTMDDAVAWKDKKETKNKASTRNIEVIIPKDMTISFAKGNHTPEMAEAAIAIRKLSDEVFKTAQDAGINISYVDGWAPVHYNTKSKKLMNRATKMFPGLASQAKSHEAGLANENVKENFITLLVNEGGLQWRKDKEGVSVNEGDKGWTEKEGATWDSIERDVAVGIYDTITRNRLFTNERPTISAKKFQRDRDGKTIIDEDSNPVLDDYQLSRYERQLANLGINPDDVITKKGTRHSAATKRMFGGGTQSNLHARRHNNMELSRSLADIIPVEKLIPFRETSPHALMTKYMTMASKRIEFSRRFGSGGEVFNALMAKADKDWMAAQNSKGTEIYAPRNQKDREAAINHMYDVFDAIQGNFGDKASLFGNSNLARKSQAFMFTASYIRTLPLATLSSLAEPLSILIRTGPKPFIKAGGKTMVSTGKDIAVFLNKLTRYKASTYRMNESEIRRSAERVALVADWAVLERLTESVELQEGSMSQWMTAKWFRINFNDQWTKLTRMWAFESGRQMIMDNVRRLQNIDLPPKTKARLEAELVALGVNTKEADQWFSDTLGDRAKPHAYLRKIDLAASRMTHEVIMSPNPANRPLWMSNPQWHMFAQLKGFQTTFFNTVVQQIVKSMVPHTQVTARYTDDGVFLDSERTKFFTEKNARIAIMTMMMLGVASFADTLKNYVKFGQGDNPFREDIYGPDADLVKYWKYIFYKIAFMGPMQFAIDAKDSQTFGGEPMFTFLGPNASWANDMYVFGSKGLDHLTDWEAPRRSWWSTLTKVLPTPVAGVPSIRDWTIDTFIPDGWIAKD